MEVLFMGNRIFLTVYHTVKNLSISMLQVSYLRGLVSQLQEDVYIPIKLWVKRFITGLSLIKMKGIPTTEPSRCFCAQIKIALFVNTQPIIM
jgi:hypothetical protein